MEDYHFWTKVLMVGVVGLKGLFQPKPLRDANPKWVTIRVQISLAFSINIKTAWKHCLRYRCPQCKCLKLGETALSLQFWYHLFSCFHLCAPPFLLWSWSFGAVLPNTKHLVLILQPFIQKGKSCSDLPAWKKWRENEKRWVESWK